MVCSVMTVVMAETLLYGYWDVLWVWLQAKLQCGKVAVSQLCQWHVHTYDKPCTNFLAVATAGTTPLCNPVLNVHTHPPNLQVYMQQLYESPTCKLSGMLSSTPHVVCTIWASILQLCSRSASRGGYTTAIALYSCTTVFVSSPLYNWHTTSTTNILLGVKSSCCCIQPVPASAKFGNQQHQTNPRFLQSVLAFAVSFWSIVDEGAL